MNIDVQRFGAQGRLNVRQWFKIKRITSRFIYCTMWFRDNTGRTYERHEKFLLAPGFKGPVWQLRVLCRDIERQPKGKIEIHHEF